MASIVEILGLALTTWPL